MKPSERIRETTFSLYLKDSEGKEIPLNDNAVIQFLDEQAAKAELTKGE